MNQSFKTLVNILAMNNLKAIFTLLAAAFACSLNAQSIETFYLVEKGDTTRVTAAISADNFELNRLSLESRSFPTATLPRNILQKVIEISNRKGKVDLALTEENRVLRERDTLNMREIATLRSIVMVQQKQVESCEQTNLMLNRSIESLNGNLNETRELAKELDSERRKGKTWAYILGGGLGFALGAILGIAAD
jgi:predicted RNase H-like nuclease (RuvC/YqgF family)